MEIVIGSWGSYNACNERALGSSWIDFADYDSWEEIEEELKKQGFQLDGIDEELFIQDIEGDWGFSGDYMHPERLFKIYKEGDLENKEQIALAFIGTMPITTILTMIIAQVSIKTAYEIVILPFTRLVVNKVSKYEQGE